MEISVKYKDNKADAYTVRKAVFMKEQGYKNEFDYIDNVCDYVTVYCDGELAGTGRLYPYDYGAENICVFGRIAVLKKFRKNHIGSAILSALEKLALEKDFSKAVLLSQETAVEFYQKNGFVLKNEPVEYDEGHPHFWMEKIF